jgi:hypothetical protein
MKAVDCPLKRVNSILTPVPERSGPLPAMSFSRVQDVTGKSFYWARIVKNLYLTRHSAPANWQKKDDPERHPEPLALSV